jgi:hypothetical protein
MNFEAQLLKHRLFTLVSRGMKITDGNENRLHKKKHKRLLIQKYKMLKKSISNQSMSKLSSVIKSTSKINL